MGLAPIPSRVPDDRLEQVRTRYVQPDPNVEGYEEFYFADTGEVIPPDDAEDLPESCKDVGPEEFHRCTKAVGERLSKLTSIPRRRAERLAVSVCGCIRLRDDEGMLAFSDSRGRVIVRRPYSDFADILRWDEEEEPEDEWTGMMNADGEIVVECEPDEETIRTRVQAAIEAGRKK